MARPLHKVAKNNTRFRLSRPPDNNSRKPKRALTEKNQFAEKGTVKIRVGERRIVEYPMRKYEAPLSITRGVLESKRLKSD